MPFASTLDESAIAQFTRLVRDLIGFAGSRLAWVMLGATVTALAEGIGLVLLVPLLGLLGVTGTPNRFVEWLAPFSLEAALGLYIGLIGGASAVICLRNFAAMRLQMDYVDDLRNRLHRALIGMEWQAFSRLRGAEITHILTSEALQAALGVQFLLNLGGWMIEVTVLVVVATRLSLLMTAGFLALMVVAALFARSLNRRTHRLGQEQGQTGRTWQSELSDNLAGMRIIRAFGMEAIRQAGFVNAMKSLRSTQLVFQRSVATATALTRTGAAVVIASVLIVATRGLGLALADTLVLIMAFLRLVSTLMKIQDGWRVVLLSLPAHASTAALLVHCQDATESSDDQSQLSPNLLHSLRLNRVGYRHSEDRPFALYEICAEIPARQVTALVGGSGAGKSTLADLLLGLSAPTQGEIRIDGRVLEGSVRRDWRSRVGYVPQDGFLFHDSIRANLYAAAPNASDDRLWHALEQAAAADFIRLLPQGLDTVVGDRGARLSGGERQRLALARALLVEPTLLILDEATSALDASSERQILEALDRLRSQLTIVVIAHRASMVRNANHVLVLDHGRLAATGSWAEVEAACGRHAYPVST